MNKETMKQGMIKVLNMYDIPWGDSAIDKIINTWADNKAPLIELLRHHPNWNDEKCYVAFDQNIKGQPDEEKIYNFINWMIIKGRRTDALFALRDYREQLLDERTASLIKEYGSDNSSGMPNVICGFNKQMKKLCDQKITIQDTFYKHEDKFYQIKEARYCWNSQMLELPLSTLIYRRKHG